MHNFQLPTAIVCATDRIALGVLRAVQRVYHIPRDCGVIGFDGVFIDQLTQPQLTTVRQPFALISEKIVAQIISQIESEIILEPNNISISPDIVVRESTRL
nr:substrate-binding domain-containing protein [Leuconostoc gasicomitatum]